jgi:flagellar basal-body rod protein FlgF
MSSSGIYSAYSGAAANLAHVDLLAANVANSDTSGYRRDQLRFDTLLGPAVDYARALETRSDLSPGSQRLDGNPLHAAIDGPGFFAVEGPDGQTLYTRRGDFRLNAAGELVLPSGQRVLGSAGALAAPPGAPAELRGDGALVAGGEVAGRLRIVQFEGGSAELYKVGESGLAAVPGAAPSEVSAPRLAPGFVESSNVDLSRELAELLLAQRSFEANMNSLRIHDEMSDRVIEAQR